MSKQVVLNDFHSVLVKNAKKVKKTKKDYSDNENAIQKYLEENSDLIPLPHLSNHGLHFNFIISKLRISDDYICDFAYLTKSTVQWEVVLFEIESSFKRIFNKSDKNITFAADFNNAYDQVTSWQTYLNEKKSDFKQKIELLMTPLDKNPIDFKYVLVIGRGDELTTQEKTNMFAQKTKNGIKVMTYDSLIRTYESSSREFKYIVSKEKHGWKLKKYFPGVSTNAFAYLKHGNFSIDSNDKIELEKEGYKISEWEKNNLLTNNWSQDANKLMNLLLGK